MRGSEKGERIRETLYKFYARDHSNGLSVYVLTQHMAHLIPAQNHNHDADRKKFKKACNLNSYFTNVDGISPFKSCPYSTSNAKPCTFQLFKEVVNNN